MGKVKRQPGGMGSIANTAHSLTKPRASKAHLARAQDDGHAHADTKQPVRRNPSSSIGVWPVPSPAPTANVRAARTP
jgi:hypothetical protein